jgi:hypothetical protein
VSWVAEVGRGNITNGTTPIWEPFLLRKFVGSSQRRKSADLSFSGDRFSVYYSYQCDPKYGKKLVQQITEGDFDSWEPPVDMVASDTNEDRPGRLVVTKVCSSFSTYVPRVYLIVLAP